MSKLKEPLSARERIAIRLFLWLINIIQPWEYDHQQKEWIEGLRKDLDEVQPNEEQDNGNSK